MRTFWQDLKTYIDGEPSNASKTDAEVWAWLNEDLTIQGDADYGDVYGWCAETDAITRLEAAAASDNVNARSLGKAGLTFVQSGLTMYLTNPDMINYLQNLVLLGIFTDGEIDLLKSKAQVTKKRYEHAGFGRLEQAHVSIVRTL